jgi:multidrug resistance efflux pump
MFIVRVPLRIAAPCEVVPQDPTVVTAPLEGIIQEIVVKPGEQVKKDQLLVDYDKQVPLQSLRAAKKQVQMGQAEVNRAETLGLTDPKALIELGLLKIKLQKDKVALDLAEYQNSQLDIKAPVNGVVIMDSPEDWRGRPVKVGEKIMMLGSPDNTKVRLWIPESDNIPLDFNTPIKVFLNISPTYTYSAKLNYIANETTLHENYIPSFVADATWEKQPEEVKLGLKGTAVLYGERVSVIYFLLRKPWLTVRNFFGY